MYTTRHMTHDTRPISHFAFHTVLTNGKHMMHNTGGERDENGLTRTKAVVVDEALAALQPALRDKEGIWTADYVRLRFRAHLPYDSVSGTAVEGGGGAGALVGEGATEAEPMLKH